MSYAWPLAFSPPPFGERGMVISVALRAGVLSVQSVMGRGGCEEKIS